MKKLTKAQQRKVNEAEQAFEEVVGHVPLSQYHQDLLTTFAGQEFEQVARFAISGNEYDVKGLITLGLDVVPLTLADRSYLWSLARTLREMLWLDLSHPGSK